VKVTRVPEHTTAARVSDSFVPLRPGGTAPTQNREFPDASAVARTNLRPLGYELTGRGLPHYARSHSCRSMVVLPSSLFHPVALVRIVFTMFCSQIRSQYSNRECSRRLLRAIERIIARLSPDTIAWSWLGQALRRCRQLAVTELIWHVKSVSGGMLLSGEPTRRLKHARVLGPQGGRPCSRARQAELVNFAPRASDLGRGGDVAASEPPEAFVEGAEPPQDLGLTRRLVGAFMLSRPSCHRGSLPSPRCRPRCR